MDAVEVEISAVAYGGAGIARYEGKVYFVADAVPGDRVEIEVLRDHERYAEARIQRMIAPSHLRGPSPCAFSEACGGCQWLQIAYPQQLEWKAQFVASALQRIGGLGDWSELQVHPSPGYLNYRNRIHIKGRITDSGSLVVGYFARGSRDFVPVNVCQIADTAINRCLLEVVGKVYPGIPAQPFKMEVQVLRRDMTDPGKLLLTIFPEFPHRRPELAPLLTGISERPDVAWCGFVQDAPQSPKFVYDTWGGIDFFTQPGLFQQVNLAHNRHLRELVMQRATEVRPSRILDVYCGSGNLSLPLARLASYVEGIEMSAGAIHCARHAAAANGFKNTTFLIGDAVNHLWKCAKAGETFDLVVVDPPREGLFKGVNPLLVMQPQHVIYVSCDPTTLARDLGRLVRKGYALVDLQGFDFFPNTYHVETVAYLRRIST